MKKKTKKLISLCVVFVVLLGGYALLGKWQERQDARELETEEEELLDVTEFTVSEIESYSYKNDTYETGFALTQEGYVHLEDTAFPVNETTIESQIAAIADLEALQLVTGTDKAEYGLEEPQIVIEVMLEDGTKRSFYIGDEALFEAAHYVLDVENDVIFLCEESLYDEFAVGWSELVAKEEMSKPTSDEIVSVTLETDGETTLEITYDESLEYPWQLTTADGTFHGDTDAVTERLGIYQSYSVNTTLTYNCEEFSAYGLSPAATVVTVKYIVTDEAGTQTEETLMFEFAAEETEDGVYYTRINGSPYVYGVTSYYMGELTEFVLEDLLVAEEEETTEEETETEGITENTEVAE